MIEFALGIAVGAAFAPFWMKVWGWIKTKISKDQPKSKSYSASPEASESSSKSYSASPESGEAPESGGP